MTCKLLVIVLSLAQVRDRIASFPMMRLPKPVLVQLPSFTNYRDENPISKSPDLTGETSPANLPSEDDRLGQKT